MSIGFLVQLIWPKVAGKLKWIPGALPAVVLVTLIGLSFEAVPRVQIESITGAVWNQISLWSNFDTNLITFSLIATGLGLSLVASAESLLTARAIEGMGEAKGMSIKTNLDRELLAQGSGNLPCGLLGAIPITGVIV